MAKTKIEWTATRLPDGSMLPGYSFNPWIGCQEVSAACDHCYARDFMTKKPRWATAWSGDRFRTSKENWRTPLSWNREAERSGIRRKVFCASLADVFDNHVDPQWRVDLWALIESTSALDWLLLTKRPQNIAKMMPVWWEGDVPGNLWLGVTVENQEEADRRIPHLLSVPAKVHFLSCEPLLGPVDLRRICANSSVEFDCVEATRHPLAWPRVDWVITGGESGPNARPSNPQWFRDIGRQCADAGVLWFHKQNGEFASVSEIEGPGEHFTFPDNRTVRRVGKARAGAMLDGIEHKEMPT